MSNNFYKCHFNLQILRKKGFQSSKKIASIKEYREALITDLVTGKRRVPHTRMS